MDSVISAKIGSAETETAPRILAGRHAVVTGASRGIGAAIAGELARLGADLTLIARNPTPLRDLAATLGKSGVKVRHGVADVTDEAALAKALADAASAFGAPAILINNAGAAESAPFARTDPALWRRMIDVNLNSAYAATRAALPAMTAAGWGRIINIASTAGLKGYAYVSAYVAAKHGLVGLTRALAIEVAKTGVTVNAICPGYTDTPMVEAAVANIAGKTGQSPDEARATLAAANPMGRLIRPEEVAAAVGFLCRPASAAITGETLVIAAGESV
ncbi:MAG: SDR family oxidoreductase [Rhodospirillales bacterium]|nr:SDR family oxidoreductase [Rhodospirillales bacterium]